ncbi:MBL fold metallo-hydrolase [Janthinobacterium agaricidamnosum]|uniref:MBL fold metallo-hydrolase n=1 Tax=Janthinobacterium agaricidamnosum TaxID=55508 RepID=UPI001186870D|nr:MBL fold metallo-hydrolase [Janthinobacterium agaricidamnosum]
MASLLNIALGQNSAPRYTLRLPAEPAPALPLIPFSGTLQFSGSATAVIQYQGVTIVSEPDGALSPPADLVLLSQLPKERLAGVLLLKRDTPIVSTVKVAQQLRELGFQKLFPLKTWDAIHVSKGAARLRLTAMPGRAAPGGPDSISSMLDFGTQQTGTYRIFIIGDAAEHGDIEQIPQRFPGADLALLHLNGARLLGVVTSAGQLRISYLDPGQRYEFSTGGNLLPAKGTIRRKPSARPAR